MITVNRKNFDWKTPEVQRMLLSVIRGDRTAEEASRLLGQPPVEVRRSVERYRERLLYDASLLDAVESQSVPVEELTAEQLKARITALVGHRERVEMQIERHFAALVGQAQKDALASIEVRTDHTDEVLHRNGASSEVETPT